jgi:hypothetical protein
MSRFFGRLRVSPGEVVFAPEGRANSLNVELAKPILHRGRELAVVAGRLLPPWMNTGLVLVDSASPARIVGVVLLTAWQRRAVVAAATSAGFEVTVYRTSLSAGGGIGSVSELERFRREHR